MKNISTKIASTIATSAAVCVAIAANVPQANAASFSWLWNGDDDMFSAEGSFTTDVESGTITEDDVSFHEYTVFENGNPLYRIDLVNATIEAFDGLTEMVFEGFHDFEYVMGSDRFSFGNISTPDDDKFPIDFTLQTLPGDSSDGNAPIFTGLSFVAEDNVWFLERDGVELATSAGLDSGPVVESVPEPASVLGLLVFSTFAVGSVLKKKRASSPSA